MCVDRDVPWPARIGNLSRETNVAFARACRASDETTIAFAGKKWAFLVRFSVAEVMVVSMVAVWGRALVMAVSRWSAAAVAEVRLVSKPPGRCAMCANLFALRGLMVGASAKKFALHAQNTPKSAFLRLQGELFRGRADEGAVLGEVFRGWGVGGVCRANFFPEQPRNRLCRADVISDRTGNLLAGTTTSGWA